jgi:hypothetical protein
VSFRAICSSESLYKSVDFNLSIYKLDLINALEVFKNSKPMSFNNNAQDIIDKTTCSNIWWSQSTKIVEI